MPFGFQIEEAEIAPGTLGLLYDDIPQLTTADVRPFVWAVLLFRHGVKKSEIIGAITQVCAHSELYSGWSDFLEDGDDRTRLEWLVEEVLGDMVASGLVRFSFHDELWVLNSDDKFVSQVIGAAAGVNGSLPQGYIMERQEKN